MRRFRQTLQKSRLFLLGFLLVEMFFLVDGQQFVYAYQVDQQKKEIDLRSFAETFGIPVERLRGGGPSLYDSVESFFAEDVVPLAGSSVSELESSIRDFYRELERVLFPANAKPAAASPQEPPRGGSGGEAPPEGGSSEDLRKSFEERWKERRLPLVPTSDKELTHPALRSVEAKPLPVRRVEKRAARQEGRAADPRTKGVAVLPSVPRQTISKAGIAPEIVALAESLGNSPSRIFRFVHDSIDFDPKWGAVKPPLGTLLEGAGTSWDQAWLLRDLLTAAGVDARFEWGEVEITPEMLTNVTGVADPFRAGDLLTTAGVPIVLVVSGSRVVAARMSHVWIKAHVDYIPNRGVTPGPGDTWVRMDPSLNRFDVGEGVRLDEEVPFDLGEYLRSGTLLSPRAYYEEALQAYIDANNLSVAALEELKPRKSLIPENFPFVPGTLRAKVLSVAGEATEVPVEFQQQLELKVREAGGAVLLAWSTPWPVVYGKRVELAWPGATSADQSTLELHGGVFATPPFEIDLRPVVRIGGSEVATGSTIGSAEDVVLMTTLTPPQGSQTVTQFDMFAGEHAVVAVDFGRIPQEQVDRYTLKRSAATEPSEEEAWTLALAGALYLRGLAESLEHLSALRWRHLVQLNNVILAVQRGAVSNAPDGTPLTFSAARRSIDLGAMVLGVFPPAGMAPSQAPVVATLELLGSQGSFLEGETLTALLGSEHVSAVSFLTRAVREGQSLTAVDAGNVDPVLNTAELSATAEAAVRAGVESGQVAWISEQQLTIEGWETTGYVLEDPDTGAGSYSVTFERHVTNLDGAVSFHHPKDLDVVTAPIDVIASIDAEGLESWTLSTRPTGEGAPRILATGTEPVDNAMLGQFDPTVLLNGMHDLVLTGTDVAGQIHTGKITVSVEGEMKVGNFTLSFMDLAIPMSGIDIEIVRTYDSRDKAQGDFGIGWSLDIRKGSYRNNRPPGDGWQILTSTLPCQQIQETKSHLTTVRLSDREIYRFRLNLVGAATVAGGCFARAQFDYVDGPFPGALLEILGNDEVIYLGSSDTVIDRETLDPFVPHLVKLTTPDGRVVHLDLEAGVTHLEDRNGNTLHITPQGIHHSSGEDIEFVRDLEGRIVEIFDPSGNSNHYEYDAAGDLINFTDRSNAPTHFIYENDHFLSEIINALGVRAVRTEYDEAGRAIRIIDADGKVTELDHDLAGRREVITDRLGTTRIHEYDERGNIVRETDGLGGVLSRTFDSRGNTLVETNPLGHSTNFTYTPTNQLAKITDALGNTTTYTYNSRRLPLTVTDFSGTIRNEYDSKGNLIRSVDPLGGEITHIYDSVGNIISTTDALGQTMTFDYDSRGNQTKVVDPLGNETTFTYDANGNQISETRNRTLINGSTEILVTHSTYDAMGRLTSTTAADGSKRSFAYDLLGSMIQETDEAGRVTRMNYDYQGLLTSTTFPDGTTETQSYDAEGRLTTQTDRAGRTTTYRRNALGRIESVTSPDGATTSRRYNAAGEITEFIDANGNTTTVGYDEVNRRTAITDALGHSSTFTYDADSNLISATDALGNRVRTVYDSMNRPTAEIYADGTSTKIAYDALGRRAFITDPGGKVTHFTYDALGRLTSVTDALGQVTSYSYDEVGNRVSQTDANGHTTLFEYDRRSRTIARVLPDGSRETMTYNVDGTLASHIDFMGTLTTYKYDMNGHLIEKVFSGGSTVRFTYNSAGQRASVTDGRGTTTYAYDARDRLVEKVEPTGHRLTYSYDLKGSLTRITATVGSQVLSATYSHDVLGRPVGMIGPSGGMTASNYDANGNLTSLIYPNGIVTNYTYDSLNRLTDLVTSNDLGDVVQSYRYTLGPAGNRLAAVEHDGTARQYQYDDLYRLTRDQVVDASQSLIYQHDFSYDSVGNIQSRIIEDGAGPELFTSLYDDRDRLQSSGSSSYSWNDNGNLVNLDDSNSTTYGWNMENRLSSITLADGTLIENVYDVDGNRVRSTVTPPEGTPSVIDYLVDATGSLSHVVAEVVDGTVQTVYSRMNGQLMSIYHPVAGTLRYYHEDGLGSVRVLSNTSGEATDYYTYTAFGKLLGHVGSDEQPYRFAGEPFDPNSGFYYNRARWLDASTGRFISMDHFDGFPAAPMSLHRYIYANANPVNLTDPTGLFGGLAGSLEEIKLRAAAAHAAMRVLHLVTAILSAVAVAEYIGPTSRSMSTLDRYKGMGEGYWGPEIQGLDSSGQIAAIWTQMRILFEEFRKNNRGSDKWNSANHFVELQLPSGPTRKGGGLQTVAEKKVGKITFTVKKGGNGGRIFHFRYGIGPHPKVPDVFIFQAHYLDFRVPRGAPPIINVHCHIHLFPLYPARDDHRSCQPPFNLI